MNILVLSWRDPKHPLAGGAEQVMHEHMKAWVAKGHGVTLFSSKVAGKPESEVIDGVGIIRRGHQHLGVQVSALLWYIMGSHKKFDLVVDQFHGIPFFTPLFVGAKKLAVLQEVAGKVWLKNDLRFPINYIVGLVGLMVEPLVFLLYKKVPFMVGSPSAKDALIDMGINKNNITVVPHGVIVDKPKVKVNKEKTKTILFLGALAKDKGIEDAIECFGILSGMGKYKFWIVGKGGESYIEKLKEKVNDLGIKDNTKFWGFVSQEKKFELLSKSHLLVNPSLLEGWGLVNIEANAVGTPVVAYNSPGLIDSVKDGASGVIVKTNTPNSLATEVDKLLSDSDKYSMLIKSSIFWAGQFVWSNSVKKSLKLIDSVVAGKYSHINE